MSACFVTATGTDIGKTFVARGLIRALRRQDRAVAALKPVLSGFEPAEAAGSDSGLLLSALGRPVTPEEIARISPWRFAAPLAPDMAAVAETHAAIARFAVGLEIVELPRLPAGSVDHAVFDQLAQRL